MTNKDTITTTTAVLIIFLLLCVFSFNIWKRYIAAFRHTQRAPYIATHYYSREDFPIQVFYDYDPDRRSNLGNEYNIVQAAINDINSKTNFSFFQLMTPGLVPQDIKSVLHISDRAGKHECPVSFDGRYGVLAHAYYPPYKKICLDSSELWTDTKLANTLVHEMCHSLGLIHRDNTPSIMNSVYSEKNKGIQPQDVQVLRRAYPFIW